MTIKLKISGLLAGFAILVSFQAQAACPQADQDEDLKILKDIKASRRQARAVQHETLQKSMSYLQKRILKNQNLEGKGVEVGLGELQKRIQKDPNYITQLGMKDNCSLGQINSELTALATQMRIDSDVNKCQSGTIGLKSTILQGAAQYDACAYGYHFETVVMGEKKNKYEVPKNIMSNDATALLKDYEGIRSEIQKDRLNEAGSPLIGKWSDYALQNKMKGKDGDSKDVGDANTAIIVEQAEALKNTYSNAFSRPIMNQIAFKIRTGQLKGATPEQTAQLYNQEINKGLQDCKYCSPRDREAISSRVRKDLNREISSGRLISSNPTSIVSSICSQLKETGIDYFSKIDKKTDGLDEGQVIAQSLSKETELLRNQRKEAIDSILSRGGDLAFLVTKAMGTVVTGNYDVSLRCTPESIAKDEKLVLTAMKEVEENTKDYAGKLNDAVQDIGDGKDRSAEGIKEALRKFIKLSPEALGSSLHGTGLGRSWVCDILDMQSQKDFNTKMVEYSLIWGTSFASFGLSSAGIMGLRSVAATSGTSVATAIYQWQNESVAFQTALQNLQNADVSLVNQKLDMTQEQWERLRDAELAIAMASGAAVGELAIAAKTASALKNGKGMMEVIEELEAVATSKNSLAVERAGKPLVEAYSEFSPKYSFVKDALGDPDKEKALRDLAEVYRQKNGVPLSTQVLNLMEEAHTIQTFEPGKVAKGLAGSMTKEKVKALKAVEDKLLDQGLSVAQVKQVRRPLTDSGVLGIPTKHEPSPFFRDAKKSFEFNNKNPNRANYDLPDTVEDLVDLESKFTNVLSDSIEKSSEFSQAATDVRNIKGRWIKADLGNGKEEWVKCKDSVMNYGTKKYDLVLEKADGATVRMATEPKTNYSMADNGAEGRIRDAKEGIQDVLRYRSVEYDALNPQESPAPEVIESLKRNGFDFRETTKGQAHVPAPEIASAPKPQVELKLAEAPKSQAPGIQVTENKPALQRAPASDSGVSVSPDNTPSTTVTQEAKATEKQYAVVRQPTARKITEQVDSPEVAAARKKIADKILKEDVSILDAEDVKPGQWVRHNGRILKVTKTTDSEVTLWLPGGNSNQGIIVPRKETFTVYKSSDKLNQVNEYLGQVQIGQVNSAGVPLPLNKLKLGSGQIIQEGQLVKINSKYYKVGNVSNGNTTLKEVAFTKDPQGAAIKLSRGADTPELNVTGSHPIHLSAGKDPGNMVVYKVNTTNRGGANNSIESFISPVNATDTAVPQDYKWIHDILK